MNPSKRALRRIARTTVNALATVLAEIVAEALIRRLGLEDEED